MINYLVDARPLLVPYSAHPVLASPHVTAGARQWGSAGDFRKTFLAPPTVRRLRPFGFRSISTATILVSARPGEGGRARHIGRENSLLHPPTFPFVGSTNISCVYINILHIYTRRQRASARWISSKSPDDPDITNESTMVESGDT